MSNGTSNSDTSEDFKVSKEQCKSQLEYFIEEEKPGLLNRLFPRGTPKLDAPGGPSQRAVKMVETLVNERDCAVELAFKFMVLTLYDLVILLDDSTSMAVAQEGKRPEHLRRVLTEVSDIYSLARPEGINSVRFLNTRQGKKDVTPDKVADVLRVKYYGLTMIGTSLQKKIIEPFVEKKKMDKPLLVMVITDGDIEGEPQGRLKKNINNCIHKLQTEPDRDQHDIAFYFAHIGNDPGAKKLIRDLDNDPTLGQWIDCFPVESRIESVENPKKKWNVLSKLLLGALYRDIDREDKENDDSEDEDFDRVDGVYNGDDDDEVPEDE
ncbi:hypothetical protein K440DRAFT_599899 [Wilcoxina mikolae CBS 423.85]|nr:hypothetical protein K440DRAFT_599899 [Wilcoxina mikolae CBS 423.85]